MKYVILETFNDEISLITDELGNVLVFDTLSNAEYEACACQKPIIVPLINIINRLKKADIC